MIVIDSSIWIDHFNSPVSKGAVALTEVLRRNESIAIHLISLTEVLMGFKDERHFKSARAALLNVPRLVSNGDSHVHAAQLFRILKKKGVTVRGAIDCIIAQACIDLNGVLLTRDRDFEQIAKWTDLKVWLV